MENKFDYPKAVLIQATDENELVTMHALNLFDSLIKMKWEYDRGRKNAKKKGGELSHPNAKHPWEKDYSCFNEKDVNHTIRMCFILAEQFRQGQNIDMNNRLEQINREFNDSAPSILKPSVSQIKSHLHQDAFPGLNS